MNKFGKVAALGALLMAAAPSPAEAGQPNPHPAIQTVLTGVSPRVDSIIDCDDPVPATLDRSLRGTDKELQFELAQKRHELTCDSPSRLWFETPTPNMEALSAEMRAMYERIKTVTTLSRQTGIDYYGVDMHLDFNYNGQSLGFDYEEGEGSYLAVRIGSKQYSINVNSFPDSAYLYFQNSNDNDAPGEAGEIELSANPAKAREVNQALDVIITGLQNLLAQPPVYRLLIDHPNVVSNGGLNVRDDNGNIKAMAPFGTYLQVIGAPENGCVFAYFMGTDGLDAGWVSEKYLGPPQSSYNQNTDQRVEHPIIARMRVNETSTSNGGLNLRTSASTQSTVITRIPVGTIVEVTEKSAAVGDRQWAHVRYTDPTTGETKTGWACIYQTNQRFMDAVR